MIVAGSANPLLLADDGYQIQRSLRLRASAGAYLNRTLASGTGATKCTWSGWLKLGSTSAYCLSATNGSGADNTSVSWFSIGSAGISIINFVGNVFQANLSSAAVFRDPSAWYHAVFVWDTTNATAADRAIAYINGVRITLTGTFPSLNNGSWFTNGGLHTIGKDARNAQAVYSDGYLAEVNFIDGQALTPSAFGQTDPVTGVWAAKKYAGTYGTNGFYLPFTDNSAATAAAIGKDFSGNGNNWTPNNISVTAGATYDSMLDVPLGAGGGERGNYATLNPLLSTGGVTANASLQVTTTVGVGHSRATIPMPASGKWYAEFTAVSASTGADYIFGIVGVDTAEASYGYTQTPSYSYSAFGERIVNNTFTASFYSSYTTGDVIGCAVDLDANQLTWYKNGTAQTVISIANGSYFWMVTDGSGSRQVTAAPNFGQRPFTYTPPTGFKALHTGNLPDPVIKLPKKYFDVLTWTGDNTSPKSRTGLQFQPDLVWVKDRSAVANHALFDSVRGTGAVKILNSDTTLAERGDGASVVSFDAGGFTTAVGSVNQSWTNNNGEAYVGWQWKRGATAGFDIVTYTGTGAAQNVAHSLGVAPRMIIAKRRNAAVNWFVGHASLPSWAAALEGLNTTAAANNAATAVFNSTAPTSSVFTVGTDLSASGGTYVAYLFSEVAGFSRFGSYTGNGSADGPFVFCGFRPRFVMVKRTDAAADWVVIDTARNEYNASGKWLSPNRSDAEFNYDATYPIDILSNGFKLRNSVGSLNSGTFIFACFADSPFKYSLAR